VCGTSEGEGEGRRLRWPYMVDGLHKPIWNRTKKPFAMGLRGRDNVNNVHYKSNQNCHYEFPHIMNTS
jgi:hypothetical protein